MITLRKSQDRGHADHGWLKSYHTFSFADYHDPKFMGFRRLRVMNEDWVQPAEGFGTHPHRDMEIITYVVEGALEHKDSMGTGSVIRPGDVQVMSAGTGVTHSEFNHSKKDLVHLLQIWIMPAQRGIKPTYQQKVFGEVEKADQLCLIVSGDGRKGSLKINQDADLYAAVLSKNNDIVFSLDPRRFAWIQLIRGEMTVNGTILNQGDGASIEAEKDLQLHAIQPCQFLLFDLA